MRNFIFIFMFTAFAMINTYFIKHDRSSMFLNFAYGFVVASSLHEEIQKRRAVNQ